jgi:integrase
MASVYKRARSPYWQIRYIDRNGREKSISSKLTDKRAAKRDAEALEQRERRIRQGLISPAEVEAAQAASVHVRDHIAEFIEEDHRRGLAARRIQLKRSHLERFIEAEGISSIGQVDGDAIKRHMRRLVEHGMPLDRDGRSVRLREQGTESGEPMPRRQLSPASANEFRTTAMRFLNWLVETRRLAIHPCPGRAVPKMNAELDRRRRRAAMTPDQVERLLKVADRHGRGEVYRVALLTGLRRNELQSLRWNEVRLDDETPSIQLRAEATKAKRMDAIPLHPVAAEVLASIRQTGFEPKGPVFSTVPSVQVLYRDLEEAGIQERDGRRAVPSASGETIDFHSFRMTLATMLANEGVNALHLKRIMRHASITTTDRHYAGMNLADLSRAFAAPRSVYTKVSTPSARTRAGRSEPVRTARPQTQTAPRSEAESVAGLGDQLRGGASKRVKGLEPSTFTLAT